MKTFVFYSSSIGIGMLLASCIRPISQGPSAPSVRQYTSNGKQIYFTATSQRSDPITFTLANGGGMMGGMMGSRMSGMIACATCHGADGRGGQVQMMMTTFEAPDIRYTALIEGDEQPPYTDETIKRAITQGVDPAGKALEWQMPRWSMSADDLNDLLAYLKTLK